MDTTYRVDVDISPDAPGDDNYCPYANVVVIREYNGSGKLCERRRHINKPPEFFRRRAAETAKNSPLAAYFEAAADDIAAAYPGQSL